MGSLTFKFSNIYREKKRREERQRKKERKKERKRERDERKRKVCHAQSMFVLSMRIRINFRLQSGLIFKVLQWSLNYYWLNKQV